LLSSRDHFALTRPNPAYRQIPVLLVAFAILAMTAWSYWQRVSWGRQVQIEGVEEPNFGGNDWVVWEDSEDGVVARSIHPLIKSNPLLYDQFFREGDILRRIEYDAPEDIYRAEMVRELSRHTAPGTVVLYWVDRLGSTQPGGGWRSLLIEHSFRPSFTFVDNHTLWSFSPWFLMVGNFIALITILIILPIVRRAFKESWSILLVVLISFLVFLTMGVHHLNLLVNNSYNSSELEQGFTFAIALLLPLYGVATFTSRVNVKWRWLAIIHLIVIGLSGVLFWELIYRASYFLFAVATQQYVLTLFTLMVLTMLLLSIFQMWTGRSRIDKTFHVLALLYVGPLFLLYFGNLWQWSVLPKTTEFTDLLCYGAIFIPLINAAAAQLKFGRVSLVLTTTLQYVVLSALVLLLYYILHLSLISFGLSIKYQAYLELALVIVVVFILRAVYKQYEPSVRRYFVLAQQSRRDKIDRFISSISQYPSSQKLLDDLVVSLREYYGASIVGIRIKGDPDSGNEIGIDEVRFEELYRYLKTNGIVWARNRQITQHQFPAAIEAMMQPSPFALAAQITVNAQIYGMIMVGRKRRGVFNIDDQELLQRIIQQTRLTLGVLHLLEREKLLMQKNYEANLTALRSQINPHFLFNTLNTISALIHDDPDDAEIAVEKLAFIFRYTLKNSDKASVTLKDELSLVRTYLDIEKIRFGERLQLQFEIDETQLDVSLPAFVVQTVVENCIKHGIAKIIGKGQVSIQIAAEGDFVRCIIEDNGPGIDLNRIHASTGLSNSHTRMSQIYQREDLLKFENTGNGTRVTILLPK
jgi:signal transduction histidine kinase